MRLLNFFGLYTLEQLEETRQKAFTTGQECGQRIATGRPFSEGPSDHVLFNELMEKYQNPARAEFGQSVQRTLQYALRAARDASKRPPEQEAP